MLGLSLLLSSKIGEADLSFKLLYISQDVAGSCEYASSGTCATTSTHKAHTVNNAGAVSYSWVVTGATIVSGQDTDTLVVSTDSNTSDAFNLECTVNDGVDTDVKTATFTHNRSMITPISISSIVESISGTCNYDGGETCTTQSTYVATLSDVSGTAVYTWNVTGATIVSGQGTDTLVVSTTNDTDTIFNVALSVSDDYDTASSNSDYTHTRTPNDTLAITAINETVAGSCEYNTGETCIASSSYGAVVTGAHGVVTYLWSVSGATITAGQGTATITAGQGTATITVETDSNADAPFNITCDVSDDVGIDTLSLASTHTRSKAVGILLGDELITNGDFNSAVGWSLSAGYSITGGQHIHDGTGSNYSSGNQSITLESGATYQIEIDMAECDDFAKCGFRFGTNAYKKWSLYGVNSLGKTTFDYTADSNSSGLFRLYGMNGFAFKNNSISVRKKL